MRKSAAVAAGAWLGARPKETPLLMASGDRTGDSADDVLLTTITGAGKYKVYLYKNESGRKGKNPPPAGTGLNFSLY